MKRGSGILLHITSLPSSFGIGDMGPEAYKFAEFLTKAGQNFWQILPLNPTEVCYYNSPYHSISTFAYNPILISPEFLMEDGLLDRNDLNQRPEFPSGIVDFEAVTPYKENLLQRAYENFKKKKDKSDFEKFFQDNFHWLDDFSLFSSLKKRFNGKPWNQWPVDLRDRQPEALNSIRQKIHDSIEREKFIQYTFFRQWSKLKTYCNDRGIHIIGDLPIYVEYNSADVWTNPHIFKLDDNKSPYVVAGVPPDYFSETGQLWGSPIYNWDKLRETGYSWWLKRLEHNFRIFNLTRIDHFRGLVAYWEVPSSEETAINGKWVEAPVEDFFNTALKRFLSLPVIAEDLGVITPDVREIIHRLGLPGMKILLFAFGEGMSDNPYIPHNLERNCILYTGTHDNNTVRGWFEKEAAEEDKKRLFSYLARNVSSEDINWELIQMAMMSVADTVIFPIQDILGLDEKARMNTPSTVEGNWRWQLMPKQLGSAHAEKLLKMIEIYGRK